MQRLASSGGRVNSREVCVKVCIAGSAAILCTGVLDVIRNEAWKGEFSRDARKGI